MARHTSRSGGQSFNDSAACLLRECADRLHEQNANPFRVNAYRRAAETLEALDVDARQLLRDKGLDGLIALPAIGTGLASAIDEIARTGRLARPDRLRGSADPEALLRSVPGIGATLARRIHTELDVDTLEELEIAAHDGRLAELPRMGPRRIAAIRAGLASLLGYVRGAGRQRLQEPNVDVLLDVDREYREAAAAKRLPVIAPRRFNPERKPWLPILHTSRAGWHFTVLYSNTARAHELGRTRDWVVIYFHDDDHNEGQRTVVTETQGAHRGRRVVRGREAECESGPRP